MIPHQDEVYVIAGLGIFGLFLVLAATEIFVAYHFIVKFW